MKGMVKRDLGGLHRLEECLGVVYFMGKQNIHDMAMIAP